MTKKKNKNKEMIKWWTWDVVPYQCQCSLSKKGKPLTASQPSSRYHLLISRTDLHNLFCRTSPVREVEQKRNMKIQLQFSFKHCMCVYLYMDVLVQWRTKRRTDLFHWKRGFFCEKFENSFRSFVVYFLILHFFLPHFEKEIILQAMNWLWG